MKFRFWLTAWLVCCLVLSSIFPVHAAFFSQTLMLRDMNDADFSTSLTAKISGSTVVFQISLIGGTTARSRVSLALPAGLTASGYTVDADSCGLQSGISQSNAGFTFDIAGTASTCENIISVRYTTASLAAVTHSIGYTVVDSVNGVFYDGDDIATTSNNVTLTASNKVMILKAASVDANADGFIEGYDLTLNTPLPSAMLPASQIQIAGGVKTATGITFSGTPGTSVAQIRWSDGFFTTADTPAITVTWDVNYAAGTYFVGVVEDRALPKIWVSVAAGKYTSTQTVTLSSNEWGTLQYSTGGAYISYSTGLVLSTATSLFARATDLAGNTSTRSLGNYRFVCAASSQTVNTHAYAVPEMDFGTSTGVISAPVSQTGGTQTFSQSFICSALGILTSSGAESANLPVCTSGYHVESGACASDTRSCAITNGSGQQTWNGSAWGACAVTSCASGYSISWNSCIKPSSGGGGWGGGWGGGGMISVIDICPMGDKSGSLTDGKCTAPSTSTGATSTGMTSTGSLTQTGTTGTGSTQTGVTLPPIAFGSGFTVTGSLAPLNTNCESIGSISPSIVVSDKNLRAYDSRKNWAWSYIRTLIRLGVVNNATAFGPDRSVTRAEFLKMALNSTCIGLEKPETLRFSDVKADDWFAPYVAYAQQKGIISASNPTFRPGDKISRAEAAKILAIAAGVPLSDATSSSFSDVDATDGLARYIQSSYEAQILSGQMVGGKRIFRPRDPLSRAELAKLVVNAFELD